MTFINLAPDAKGIETIARTFREDIERAAEKIANADAAREKFMEDDAIHFQFTEEENDAIGEGLYLVIDQGEKRIASLSEALAECELAIEANNVLAGLRSGLAGGIPISNGDLVQSAIELIGKLAEKAGMKG